MFTNTSPIIDVNPSLSSSMHVDMSAEYMDTLCFHHQTQGTELQRTTHDELGRRHALYMMDGRGSYR